ncbi:SET domain-containing protein SmydA-8 [Diachasma alloeum]|uniref:SET domain-containing protein SmydA-8 n=1 Tax=Diachasma alloeum TaxID=454923 RepID=UPI00073849EA|nr:SET domain-containing protein SmydA-8 [Diachasma alloeum]
MLIKEIENEIQKYEEASSGQLGRYLIAGKQLSPGEVILREKPLAVGPAVFNDNLLCFGCQRTIPNLPLLLRFHCKTCGTAIFCSSPCEARRGLHTPPECAAFKGSRHLRDLDWPEFRGIIFPLRLWLLQEADGDSWRALMGLEAHLEDRKDTRVWQDRQETVVDVLRRLGLAENADNVLQRICGIVDVNSFELRSPGTLENSPLRGLYPKAALMAHDCRGNTHLTVDDDFNLTVYASLSIDKGAPILFNYTSSLLGTLERRAFLREGKYFNCNCAMCRDPEELGAHLSSILCPRCREGFLGVEDPDVGNPFVRKRNWICGYCGRSYSGKLVRSTLDLAQWKIIKSDHSRAKDLEELIKSLTRTFHPHHSLLLNLKQKLLAIYRKEMASLRPQKQILQRMLELCREFVEVLEIVEPGISRLKGIMLYEMHLPMVILSNRAYTSREISSEELAVRLEEAARHLKKALSMLLLEPATTPEGLLAKRALQEYKTLRQNLEDVKSLPPAPKSTSFTCKK